MSQTVNEKIWVLLSSTRKDTKQKDLERITPEVSNLVDQWHSQGKFVWSGPLDNDTTGMAVFEASEEEAKKMFEQHKKITDGVLDTYLYQWEALPFLSVLS